MNKMIRAVQIGASGKPELVQLPDPMKDGWKAFWADIGDRMEVSAQSWITPHLHCLRGKAENESEPVGQIEGKDVFAPSILVGAVWNDRNEAEAVGLTDGQIITIYQALGEECPVKEEE